MDLSRFVDTEKAGLLYEAFPGIDWEGELIFNDSDFAAIVEDISEEVNRVVEDLIFDTDWRHEYGFDSVEWVLDAGTIIIDVTVTSEHSRGDNYYVPDETFYNVSLKERVVGATTPDVSKLAAEVLDYVEDHLPY